MDTSITSSDTPRITQWREVNQKTLFLQDRKKLGVQRWSLPIVRALRIMEKRTEKDLLMLYEVSGVIGLTV